MTVSAFKKFLQMILMFRSDCEALPYAELGMKVRQERFPLCCIGLSLVSFPADTVEWGSAFPLLQVILRFCCQHR